VRGPWRPPDDPLEAEWLVAERGVDPEELEAVRDLRAQVQQLGLDQHPACAQVPHSQRAVTLLRFLRACSGDVGRAATMLRAALDWRQDFGLEAKLAAWRSEWKAGASARVRTFQEYDFVAYLGEDYRGLPVYVHRFSQGDPGGLVRELGEEALVLRVLQVLEDSFAVAQARMLQTGSLSTGFVEVYDVGNYGLVPNWFKRAMAAVKPYMRVGPILDKVYPERVRACFLVRAPPAFAAVWRIFLPLIPEATRKKIHIKGFRAASWQEELKALVPEAIVPQWLREDDPAHFAQAKPWGGIVPLGAAFTKAYDPIAGG